MPVPIGSAAPPPDDSAVPLASVLCTEELTRRPARPPDYEAENCALVLLAQALADSPDTVLQQTAEILLETFRVGSSGFSFLSEEDGGKRFDWLAIAGVWKAQLGVAMPRNFSPCGEVLDRGAPLLFRHIERHYPYFQPVTPPMGECLLAPFYVKGKAVGTIWIVAHDDRRTFDAEDRRQLVSMGRFASAAYQTVESRGKTVAMNEALLLGSIRQHELVEAAAALNVQLLAEMAERRKTAQELSEKARLIDLSNDAIIVRDLNNKIRLWNKGAEKLFGWTLAEVMGKDLHAFLHTEFPKPYAEIIAQLNREGRFNGEVVQIARDGRRVRSLCGWVLDRDTASIFTSYTDITDRTRAEQALRANEWRLRYATESARLTYVEVDFALGGVRRGAENYATVMGFAHPDERDADVSVGAELLLEHVLPDDRPRLKAALQEFIAGHPLGKIVFRVIGDDQIQRWIETRWSVQRGPDGKPLKSFATHLDITEQKQAEEALRESEERYRTLFDSIDEGFCVVESIFDEHDHPLDYRFLEINPTFTKQTGLRDAVGKRMRTRPGDRKALD